MTTGRINQVAAFLAHPRSFKERGGVPAVRTVQAPPRRRRSWFQRTGQHCHAERPTGWSSNERQPEGSLSSNPQLRLLPARPSDEETTSPARRALLGWDSRRGGCAASRPMPLKETGLRTDTDCSGNGFGDTLAHRVMIQAPQPWLRPGLQRSAGAAQRWEGSRPTSWL